jgi:YVTN family beta-propeller protein
MRRAAPSGVLLYCLASVLVGCADEAPTGTLPESPSFAFASTGTCEPGTRPGKIVEKVVTPPAWGVAVRDDGLAYFAAPFQDAVGITSTRTRTVDGFIQVGDQPLGVAFAPDGQTAYVTNLFSSTVSVIDVATASEVATIPLGGAAPFVVHVSPDGERLYVSASGNQVFIFETATRSLVKTVEVGAEPNGFAVHPDGRMLYVSSFSGRTVSEIDMVTETVLRTFDVGGTPQEMAVNRKGNRLYVANEARFLSEIDLQTGEQLPIIPLAGGGFGVGVTKDDGEAYVALPSAGLVQVFNLQQRKLTRQINVEGEPRRIAFSEQGSIGAISNMRGYITFVR